MDVVKTIQIVFRHSLLAHLFIYSKGMGFFFLLSIGSEVKCRYLVDFVLSAYLSSHLTRLTITIISTENTQNPIIPSNNFLVDFLFQTKQIIRHRDTFILILSH